MPGIDRYRAFGSIGPIGDESAHLGIRSRVKQVVFRLSGLGPRAAIPQQENQLRQSQGTKPPHPD
jgi:hypothetical protein